MDQVRNEKPIYLLRKKRDLLLNKTDKYVSISDYPVSGDRKALFVTYRQQLRDLPILFECNALEICVLVSLGLGLPFFSY